MKSPLPLALVAFALIGTGLWFLRGSSPRASGRFSEPATVSEPVERLPRIPEEYLHDTAFLEGYKKLFPGEHKVHDPVSVLAMMPSQRWRVRWPEYPGGSFVKITNSRGFLEERETPRTAPGRRILVLGDSHTAGVVPNRESYANVLEAKLSRLASWDQVEVINAGIGYAGPHLYLGMLRKHLDLAPDLVIATLFAGNDFWEDLLTVYLFDGRRPPNPGEDYWTRLGKVQESWSAAAWQGVNQLYRFRRFPEERERALSAAIESYASLQALCDARGMRLLAVVLPTKFDTDEDIDPDLLGEMLSTLELNASDLNENMRMARQFLEALTEIGMDCIDTTPALRAEPEPCYWTSDHHLNVRGHEVVAEVLEKHITAMSWTDPN